MKVEKDIACYAGIAFLDKDSLFVVLVVLPESTSKTHNTAGNGTGNGEILLFNVEHPVPIASWFVKKVKKTTNNILIMFTTKLYELSNHKSTVINEHT